MYTFKKFREVFVKILADFDENTFIEKLIGEVYMRILYSTKQKNEQEVILLFTLYTLSENAEEFKKIWSVFKESMGKEDQKDLTQQFIEIEVLPKDICEKLSLLKSEGESTLL